MRETQQVVVNVVNLDVEPAENALADSATDVPEWWKIYEGLNDDDVDRLDQAIRQRANLTRHFE